MLHSTSDSGNVRARNIHGGHTARSSLHLEDLPEFTLHVSGGPGTGSKVSAPCAVASPVPARPRWKSMMFLGKRTMVLVPSAPPHHFPFSALSQLWGTDLAGLMPAHVTVPRGHRLRSGQVGPRQTSPPLNITNGA